MKIQKNYEKHYNDEEFWTKIKKNVSKARKELIETALTLYYTLKDPETPLSVKISIILALGYFISPIDVIPDFLPLGFTDDLGVMAIALKANYSHITPEIRQNVIKLKEKFKWL